MLVKNRFIFSLTMLNWVFLFKLFVAYNLGNLVAGSETEEEDYDSVILSTSRNITVGPNETVQLECLVRKSPSTIVIWNQCEDASCDQIKIPLTVNKDNFIEDLRFRVLSENLNKTASSSDKSEEEEEDDSTDPDNYPINSNSAQNERNTVNSWNLEIRKFTKNDEGCYQCRLNLAKVKAVQYCIKIRTKVVAKPTKLAVMLHEPIKLKCLTDENVRLSHIRWLRNGHKLVDDSKGLTIERKPINNHLQSVLHIRRSTLSDAGTYTCQFGHLKTEIHVDVIVGVGSSDNSLDKSERSYDKIKSSDIRSHPEQDLESYPSMSPSVSNSKYSPTFSSSVSTYSFKSFSPKFNIFLVLLLSSTFANIILT